MPASEPGGALRLPARAKVNLYLHVLGRRADGYHLLDSLIAFAAFGDALTLSPAAALTLRVDGPQGEALGRQTDPDDNLVMRAARRLAEAAGIEAGADMALEKHLPAAAGLGGGSSDAAAALTGLARLWGLSLSDSDIECLALGLGADVPACLCQPRPVFVGGIGEDLVPAPALPAAGLLLVNPGIALATARVFQARQGGWSQAARFEAAPADAGALAALLAARSNDLEAPAIALAPEVAEVLRRLDALPEVLLARMSGSGATCFGLFPNLQAAEAAAAELAAEGRGWWSAAAALAGSG